jgi:hypothetical protein
MLYALHAPNMCLQTYNSKEIPYRGETVLTFLQGKYEIKALINVEMQGPGTHPSTMKRRDIEQKGPRA